VLCIETTKRTAIEFGIFLTPNMDSSNIATLRSDIINTTLNDQIHTDLTIDDGDGITPESIEVSHPNVVCEHGSGVDTKTSRCGELQIALYLYFLISVPFFVIICNI
jgi:hypothetical protein